MDYKHVVETWLYYGVGDLFFAHYLNHGSFEHHIPHRMTRFPLGRNCHAPATAQISRIPAKIAHSYNIRASRQHLGEESMIPTSIAAEHSFSFHVKGLWSVDYCYGSNQPSLLFHSDKTRPTRSRIKQGALSFAISTVLYGTKSTETERHPCDRRASRLFGNDSKGHK